MVAAAAAAAERQTQPVGEDEEPEPAHAGMYWWCRYMHCWATEREKLSPCAVANFNNGILFS